MNKNASGRTEDRPKRKGHGEPVAVPSISLPKVGGAIRGMGEKFAANPVTSIGSVTAHNRRASPKFALGKMPAFKSRASRS